MNDQKIGQIITFYSYKGGVGRSMSLANTAALLAQRRKKVLAIDFDLEAPGLHRYFLNPKIRKLKDRASSPHGKEGIIDFFIALKKKLSKLPKDAPNLNDTISLAINELLDSKRFVNTIWIRNPNNDNIKAELFFIAAGKIGLKYAKNVYNFNWEKFYQKYPDVFLIFATELSKRYDYILIDSRTGITDIGSICTVILPEKLVLVFVPNEQSLDGVLEVGRQAVEDRKKSNDLRPLPLFPLVCRVENAEEKLKEDWIKDATSRFEELFKEIYWLDTCNLTTYFNMVRIPHKSYYSYGELISAETQQETVTDSLAFSFSQFIECLDCGNPNEVDKVLKEKNYTHSNHIESLEKSLIKNIMKYGENHPDVATSYHNIGAAWYSRGDNKKAIEYFDKALAIRLKVYGNEHPHVAISYNDIGASWAILGENKKAIEYHETALAIKLKVYGNEHPQVATSYNNIGFAWNNLGDYKKAIEYLEKALAIFIMVFGEETSEVATGYNNIGEAWRMLGESKKAIDLHEKSLAILINVFGEGHPLVARSYNNLALAWEALLEPIKAKEYYEKAIAIDLKIYGENHPHTKLVLNNLAGLKQSGKVDGTDNWGSR